MLHLWRQISRPLLGKSAEFVSTSNNFLAVFSRSFLFMHVSHLPLCKCKKCMLSFAQTPSDFRHKRLKTLPLYWRGNLRAGWASSDWHVYLMSIAGFSILRCQKSIHVVLNVSFFFLYIFSEPWHPCRCFCSAPNQSDSKIFLLRCTAANNSVIIYTCAWWICYEGALFPLGHVHH